MTRAAPAPSPITRSCRTLDKLLANRLPDVELFTTGGRGVPMLAASYATLCDLKLTALVPDFRRFLVDAVARRDAFLVSQVGAVVVVWDGRDPNVRRVLELVERKGLPTHVLGLRPTKAKVRRVTLPETSQPRGMLPD